MNGGEERYARLAARLLKSETAVEPAAASTQDHRDRVVAAMALATAAKRRRRKAVGAVVAVFAAAAALVLMIKLNGGPRPVSSHGDSGLTVEQNLGAANSLIRNAIQKPLVDGVRLVEGDGIQAEQDGSARLGFANGTQMMLSQAARLRIDELGATRRFSLQRGNFLARVAKLTHGERFIVDTPEAEIEVRGTVFTVAVGPANDCAGSPEQSTVQVREGAVWIRTGQSQVVLEHGQSWRSPCPAPAAVEHPEPIAPSAGAVADHPRKVPRTRQHHIEDRPPAALPSETPPAPQEQPPAAAPTPVPDRASSHLAEQNDLFAAAMAAEHKGDHATALRKLNDLIERFPGSPLIQSARAERERILSAR